MGRPQQPGADSQMKMTIRVTLRDIYNCLCPRCKEELLVLFTGKAEGAALGDVLRRQLEPPARLEGPEDRRREHS